MIRFLTSMLHSHPLWDETRSVNYICVTYPPQELQSLEPGEIPGD